MHEGKVFSMVVEKSMVESGNVLDVIKTISKLESLGIDAFQKIAIVFHGYDSTEVEVWETPEIRKWCNKLINKVPSLFYYIENDFYQSQQTLMLCLNDYEDVMIGPKKSPEEHSADGTKYEDLPQHKIKIHVHQKSMRLMFAEIRKHARKLGKMANAEKVINEMSGRYGISTD